MEIALRRAKETALRGEVPVGAIVVIDGTVYSAGANAREATHDPTAHAEVLAIRHAAEMCESWRLETSTLYVTVEPCLLCTGAIFLSRIRRVVYGCANPKGGALRFVSEHGKALGLNHKVEIVSGLNEFECAALLREFFKERRIGKRKDDRPIETA
jgi:tRNA(adenine34) deaminase